MFHDQPLEPQLLIDNGQVALLEVGTQDDIMPSQRGLEYSRFHDQPLEPHQDDIMPSQRALEYSLFHDQPLPQLLIDKGQLALLDIMPSGLECSMFPDQPLEPQLPINNSQLDSQRGQEPELRQQQILPIDNNQPALLEMGTRLV